jgi:hypothetical protein
LRALHRENLNVYAEHLRALIRGEETDEAKAASIDVAVLLEAARQLLNIKRGG